MMSTNILPNALQILERLIAFDTVSRNSNLDCLHWIADYLAHFGVDARILPDETGTKANLYATCGPMVAGGIILSGHSDVVPVDGQDWASDPFVLTQRGDMLHGRGTCDMKGFIALALAAVPLFVEGRRPIHLAISHDEEVGCKGAPAMIAAMVRDLPPVHAAIIGEPTMMQPVNGHKGIVVHEVTVTGHSAHSSLTHLGLSANMVAVELMHILADLSRELFDSPRIDERFEPAHATLTIGQIAGGTASNILASECRFVFDLRTPPSENPDAILAPFMAECAEISKQMAAVFPCAGIEIRRISGTPPLMPEEGGAAESLIRRLTGDNRPATAVPYAAEAGQFQQAGFSTIICGPGSIEQAHQANEFIAHDQMVKGAEFMARLADYCRHG
jgi:acetylornithine deacetylase